MAMLEYSEYFTDSDYFSVITQFFFAIFLTAYILFVSYFVIMKAGLWKAKKSGVLAERKKDDFKVAHEKVIKRQLSKGSMSY